MTWSPSTFERYKNKTVPPMGQRLMTREEHIKQKHKKMAETRKEKRHQRKLAITAARDKREIQDLAKRMAEAGLRRLGDIVMSPTSTDANAISAIRELFLQAYGSPTQTNINANIDANGKPSEVSANELDTRIATVLRRVEEITGRTPEPTPSETGSPDLRKLN